MKITHHTKTLREALNRLAKIPGATKDAPGAQNIKITATIEGVWLSRSNPQALIRVHTDGEVDTEGEAVVSYAHLAMIVQRMNAEQTVMELKKGSLLLNSGKRDGSLRAYPEDPVDDLIFRGETSQADLALEDFTGLITAAASHASKIESDNALNGISLRGSEELLNICGTDRKRLFLGWMEPANPMEVDATLGLEAAESLLNVFTGLAGAVTVIASERMLAVKSEEIETFYALLEGNFPNYLPMIKQVEGQETINTIKLNREDFLGEIRDVSPFGSKGTYAAITLTPGKSEIELRGNNEAGAEFSAVMGATCKKGASVLINSHILKETMGALRGAAVEIKQFEKGIMVTEEDRKVFASAMDPSIASS